MVRKHGWQLPAHTFQVVAITVFCLLAVAFYAFFSPFLGGRFWEYASIAVYSPVALLVFVLYVRSTAINPADPGIMSKFDSGKMNDTNSKHGFSARNRSGKFDELSNDARSSLSSASRTSIAAAKSIKKGQQEAGRLGNEMVSLTRSSSCCKIGGVFCFLLCTRIAATRMELLRRKGQVKMLCFAHCAMLRCANSVNIVEAVINVLMDLIIIVGGSTTVLEGRTILPLYH